MIDRARLEAIVLEVLREQLPVDHGIVPGGARAV